MRWSDRASAAAGIACALVIAAAVPRSALADLTSEAEPNGDLVQGKRIFPGQYGVGVLAEFDSDVWTMEGVHAGDLVFAYAAAPPTAGGIDSTLTLFSNESTAAGFEGDTESGRLAAAAIGGGVAPAGGTVQIFVSGDAPIANYWLFQLVAGRRAAASWLASSLLDRMLLIGPCQERSSKSLCAIWTGKGACNAKEYLTFRAQCEN
jgi:hypothetical protein